MKPTSQPVDHLLAEVWNQGGTDLLLTVGAPPLVRVDGALRPMEGQPLTADDTERIVLGVLGEVLARHYRRESKQVDFAFSWGDRARIRGNAFVQKDAPALSLRLIPLVIPTLEQLGLPQIVADWVRLPRGFILVTGPTGSGKSTSLAAMIDRINTERAVHIITIEDPIEYLHTHKRSAVNQREVGTDTESFANALRSALREDPDVVLVGEMRDLESIQAALTIAETGHLVFATLHTNDTAQTLDRIVDVFPTAQQPQIRLQLTHTLIGVLSQLLVPKIGSGRVPAFEIMVGTHAIKNLIREGKTRQIRNLVATGQREGMQTLEMALTELVAHGLVSYEEAVLWTLYPEDVKRPRPVVSVVPQPRR